VKILFKNYTANVDRQLRTVNNFQHI